jgi:hypothetical protein
MSFDTQQLVAKPDEVFEIASDSYWMQSGATQPRILKQLKSTEVLSSELFSILAQRADQSAIPFSIITGIHTLSEGGSFGRSALSPLISKVFQVIVESLDEPAMRILKLKTCLNLFRIFKDQISSGDESLHRRIANHCVLILRDSSASEELYFSGLLMAATFKNYGSIESWVGSLEGSLGRSILQDPLMIFSNPSACVLGSYPRLCLIRGLILSSFDQSDMMQMFTIEDGQRSEHCLLSLIYEYAYQTMISVESPLDQTLLAVEIMINSLTTFRKFAKSENGSKSSIFSTTDMMNILYIVISRWENVHRINELFDEFLNIADSQIIEETIVCVQEICWTRIIKYDMLRAMLKNIDFYVLIKWFPNVMDNCFKILRSAEGRRAAGLIVDILKRQLKFIEGDYVFTCSLTKRMKLKTRGAYLCALLSSTRPATT